MNIIETGRAIENKDQLLSVVSENIPSYLIEQVNQIRQNIDLLEDAIKNDIVTETAKFGKACGNPGSHFLRFTDYSIL